jgi:hypothetical protein
MSLAFAVYWAWPPRGSQSDNKKRDNAGMNADNWIERLTLLTYRVASYATLNLADDAAMLAFIFC